jgi:phosphatase NudJ
VKKLHQISLSHVLSTSLFSFDALLDAQLIEEPKLMDRSHLHLTVAAVVCYQNKFLLVEEIDKQSGRRVLNQPAGHVEANEDLVSAVCRELLEETGLTLTPQGWLGISQLEAANGHRYVRVNFYFEVNTLPQNHQPQDADILALHWLNAAEITLHALPVRSQLVLDAITDYQQGLRLPLSMIKSPVTAVPVDK